MQLLHEKVTLKSGKEVMKYQLINDKEMRVEILSLGGILTKIVTPDKEGKFENVTLEWKDIDAYEENPGCFGALIGRVGGRIYDAKVTINDKVYNFFKNSNGNTLHGGAVGFHKKIWTGEEEISHDKVTLKLSYFSADGEEGFPGNLKVNVFYILNNNNELTIRYEAETDKDTIVNMTNHTYFNLSGDAKRSILNQEVVINSDKICELDTQLIPTGVLLSLDENEAFDFRVAKTIGKDIRKEHTQLKYGKGYDHPWILKGEEKVVSFYDPISQRQMEITTTEPGVVMYTMNNANTPLLLSNGEIAKINDGVCFETQRCPIGYDEAFKEGVLLRKEETYLQETTFKFSVK